MHKPPLDSTYAHYLISEAKTFNDSSKFSLAEEKAEIAYNFFLIDPEKHPISLADAAYQTGLAAFQLEKYSHSRQLFEESSRIWERLYPEGSLLTANALHYISLCLKYTTNYDDALIAGTKAYQIRQKMLLSNDCELAESLHLLGKIYSDLSDHTNSVNYNNRALEIAKICAGEKSKLVATILESLGWALFHQGNVQEAIATEEQSLLIMQKILPPYHTYFIDAYADLGSVYKNLKKYDQSLFYFKKALEIQLNNFGEFTSQTAARYSDIGQYYLTQNDCQTALEYFERENSIMIKLDDTKNSSYVYICADLGKTYYALKNYPLAIEWFNKMVSIWRKSYKNINSQLASLLILLGSARCANNDFEDGITNFQEAKKIWEILFGSENSMTYKADIWLATIYRKWYLDVKRDSLLEKSRYYYRLANLGLEKNLREEASPIRQKNILEDAVPYFENAISNELIFMNLKNKDSISGEIAWQLSEAMHSYLLYSSTKEANARHYAGIPDTELRHDSLLQTQIIGLEKNRRSLIQENGLNLIDSSVLAQNALIFAKKDEQSKLRNYFEKNYPDYSRLKYQLQSSSLEKTKVMLAPQQTLIEYFMGDSSLFVFVVEHEKSKIIELKLDFPLKDWIQSLNEGISGYHTAAQKTAHLYQKMVVQYSNAGYKLYEKLIQPIEEILTPELIIVPDGVLANLPFEVLLKKVPKDLSNFKTYDYLLNHYSIQYVYSATMLHQMMTRQYSQKAVSGLLAFAPFFDKDTTSLAMRLMDKDAVRYGLSALPFSGEEVYRAKMQYGNSSKVLTGKAATKKMFQDLATQFKIIHLATHGKANHLDGEFSFLAFTADEDKKSEYDLLSVGDLYNLSLHADLVVLSACETAIGEQHRGEGIVSLASAFAYAGAKSIVASLWKVNDKSTMEIMDFFYKELKLGKPKNLALHKAKLHYLSKNPGQYAHPFYWAGFIGVGDMTAIKN